MKRVFIIDDDETLRRTLVSALRKYRFEVIQARSVAEAVRLMGSSPPHLVLCDLHLAEPGRDSIVARIREHSNGSRRVPVIIMTGQAEEGVPEADDLLLKPFSLEALLKMVGRHLGPGEAEPSPKQNQKPKHRARKAPEARGLGAASAKLSPEQLHELVERVQALREEERTDFARAIHDDLTQKLTVVAIELSLLEGSLSAPAEAPPTDPLPAIRRIGGFVHELIRSAQDITARLRPKILEEFGFTAALEWLADQVRAMHGIKCVISVQGPEPALPPAAATELFRLCQEALANVASHSGATAVDIRVKQLKKRLVVQISDNGRGITLDQASNPGSLGLLSMRNRAERLGGDLEFRGEPGKGTVASIWVPFAPGS